MDDHIEPATAFAVGGSAVLERGYDGGFGDGNREALAAVAGRGGRKGVIDGDHAGIAKGDTSDYGWWPWSVREVERDGSAGRGKG